MGKAKNNVRGENGQFGKKSNSTPRQYTARQWEQLTKKSLYNWGKKYERRLLVQRSLRGSPSEFYYLDDQQIKSIGNALRSKIDLHNNKQIAEFAGETLPNIPSNYGKYVLYLNKKEVLNTEASFKCGGCLASFANTPTNLVDKNGNPVNVMPNAKIKTCNGIATLWTIRAIKAGDEIFTKYGKAHKL